MRFGVLLYLAAVALASVPAPAQAAQGAEYFGQRIGKIEFLEADSQRPLEHSRYDRSIGLKAGRDSLSRTGLKDAIQALYDTGSFSDISVTAQPEAEGLRLQFQVRLSTYFNRFSFSPGVDFEGRAPAEAIPLPVGKRFTLEELEKARLEVVQHMIDQGFYQAAVTARWARDGDGPRIDTLFDVLPGPQAKIRSLAIRGVPQNTVMSLRERLGVTEGQKYRRDRFRKRLDGLKKSFVDRGFLDTELDLKGDPESYDASDGTVALELLITNYGQVRVEIDGFKIPKSEQRRLLPVLTGVGLRPELVDEGTANLRTYLEDRGYPEAAIPVPDQASPDSSGTRLLHYMIDRGRRVLVGEVRFHGNRAIPDADLLKALQMQPSRFSQRWAYGVTRIDSLLQGSTYSISKLDGDVESLLSLYSYAGFIHATVVPLPEFYENGERVRLAYEINEGARAHATQVTINGRQPVEALAAKLGVRKEIAQTTVAKMHLKEGSPYSPALVRHDRQILLAAFNDAGFPQTSIRIPREVSDGDNGYMVDFDIMEGERALIDRIVVVGRERTRSEVIEKRIKLKPDEPLSLGKMLETQQALYSTGVFDLVRVEPQVVGSDAPSQNVIIRLQEARPRTLRYGLGYQEREKLRGSVELNDLNIFGFGQSVDLRLRGSKIEQAGILSFKQPQVRFLPVDSYLTFSGSNKQQISFTERRLDLSYQYSRPVNNHTWGMLRYSFTNVDVSEVTPDLAREETPRNLSTVAAFYVNDTRDNYTDTNARYLDPQKGFLTTTNLGFTFDHGNQSYYLSLYSQNSYYRRLKTGLLMASSFRLGFLRPIGGDTSIPVGERIPISERFFAGGGSTLRGFSTDRAGPLGQNYEPIGGNALMIGNLELSVPVMRRLDITGFYDIGNVFSSFSAVRLSDISHTIGIGLRVKTPFGPIRVDYGLNLNLSAQLQSLGYKKTHFFLNIGPPF
jgi:outer membrane protein insertion porin family